MQIPAPLHQEASFFAGREWLLPEVITWQRSNTKFFVLTGAPGAGKSMIAAWLAGSGPTCDVESDQAALLAVRKSWHAGFFCSQRLPGAAIDARTFVHDVASQLAAREPLFAEAALAALPSTQKIDVRVERNLGTVIGLRTTNLSVSGVDTTDAFSIAVKEPLRALASSEPHRSFFLLVDGLDESLGYGRTSIAELVASMGDLPVNVKVFASFKRDRRIFELLGGSAQTTGVDLSDAAHQTASRRDVARYVTKRMSGTSLADDDAVSLATTRIAHAADGNFQYARHLVQEIAFGNRNPDDLTGLPRGLEALYSSYLDRTLSVSRLHDDAGAWQERFARILGPLTIAEAPLPSPLLAHLAGVTVSELAGRLDGLQPLVQVEANPRPSAAFFHNSMADYFAAEILPDGSANTYFISRATEHRRLTRYYRTARASEWRGDWSICDDYGLAHLAYHMFQVASLPDRSAAPTELYELALDTDYHDAQRGRFGDSTATARACTTALSVAVDRTDTHRIRELLRALSRSPDAVLRGVAIGGLTDLHQTNRRLADGLLKDMINAGDDEQATAFNAVFRIGVSTAGVGRWMALSRVPLVRQTAAYGAYLDWLAGRDAAVTSFLADLAREVRGYRLFKSRRILRYLAMATIQIYISQCHERRTAEAVHHVWYELVRRRIRAHAATPAFIERILINSTAGTTMAQRISDVALLADLQPPSRLFRASGSERLLFLAGVDLLEPDADLAAHYGVVAALLQSEILFHRVVGSTVVATWAHRDLAGLEPILRRGFDDLNSEGQLWHLFSFGTLFPPAHVGWGPFVEWQTSRVLDLGLVSELVRRGDLLTNFNVALLPLGLACGRSGLPMSVIESYLEDAIVAQDDELAAYLLEGLGYVGFYWPEPALSALRLATSQTSRRSIRDGLVAALGTMAVLRPALIDLFLEENECQDLRALVQAAVDVATTKQYVDRIGFFNNSVNQAVRHPVMRDGLLLPSLRILGEARSQREYIRRYTPVALQLLRQYDYKLLDWWAEPHAAH
jgi:hypothetical protein